MSDSSESEMSEFVFYMCKLFGDKTKSRFLPRCDLLEWM